LEETLQKANITQVFVCGLAYDYCVGCSALDAKTAGFSTYVIDDATRGVNEESVALMKQKLKAEGVKIIPSKDVSKWMSEDTDNLIRPMIVLPKDVRQRGRDNEVISLEQMLNTVPVKDTVLLKDMLSEGPTQGGNASPPSSPNKSFQQMVKEEQTHLKEEQRLKEKQKQQQTADVPTRTQSPPKSHIAILSGLTSVPVSSASPARPAIGIILPGSASASASASSSSPSPRTPPRMAATIASSPFVRADSNRALTPTGSSPKATTPKAKPPSPAGKPPSPAVKPPSPAVVRPPSPKSIRTPSPNKMPTSSH